MRKIKQTINYTVPSWNFCNKDETQRDGRYSKELCKFCIKSKEGHYCLLYDEKLTTDPTFVHKTAGCINASAGFRTEVAEIQPTPNVPAIDPRFVIRETLKTYKKTVNDLMAQNYPRSMAEAAAEQYILSEK